MQYACKSHPVIGKAMKGPLKNHDPVAPGLKPELQGKVLSRCG